MLKILIMSPIIGIISISLITIINKINLEKNKNIYLVQNQSNYKLIKTREIGEISGIITYYISLYILMKYNNNNIEYQLREKININWYELNIGIDGISIILIILTTFIFPILIILIPKVNTLNIKNSLQNSNKYQPSAGISLVGVINKSRIEAKEIISNKLIEIMLFLEIIILLLFCTLDIFLFYLIFEILLIPFFILISQYGSKEHMIKNKVSIEEKNKINITKTSMEATKKFFFYSLFGSLFLFIAIILLYYKIGSTNNEILKYYFINNYSFKSHLNINIINNEYYLLLFLWMSILLPLIIKIPIFPFHSWLPLAHAEANTIGSILLAAILLKIGSYGILRYIIELFNSSIIINTTIINNYLFPIIIIFSTLSIIYCSFSTIRQIDIKRIIAYSSIVHMNYSIISLFTLEYKSLIGGGLLIISHALISSGLFLLIGILYIRYSTRIYYYYQHLVNFMPIFTTMFFLLILNLISIPFSSSFISELLMLSGILKSNIFICVILCISLFLNTFYSIWLFNRISFGVSSNLKSQISQEKNNVQLVEYIYKWKDLSINEFLCLFSFIFFSFFFGLFPNSILNSLSLSILRILS